MLNPASSYAVIAEMKTKEMRTRMKLYYFNSKRNIYTIIVIYIYKLLIIW